MHKRTLYLILITLALAAYYLFLGIYLNRLGYYNQESLFYLEKTKILFDGVGNRLKVMGLTAPILPFYGTAIFSPFNLLAPVIASAIGTAILFYIMASTPIRRTHDDFYFALL